MSLTSPPVGGVAWAWSIESMLCFGATQNWPSWCQYAPNFAVAPFHLPFAQKLVTLCIAGWCGSGSLPSKLGGRIITDPSLDVNSTCSERVRFCPLMTMIPLIYSCMMILYIWLQIMIWDYVSKRWCDCKTHHIIKNLLSPNCIKDFSYTAIINGTNVINIIHNGT